MNQSAFPPTTGDAMPSASARKVPTLCRRSRSEDETALGHNRPDQNASALTTSPPARVPRAFQIERLILLLMNRTEPSMSRTFTPPGWNELAAMNESMTP